MKVSPNGYEGEHARYSGLRREPLPVEQRREARVTSTGQAKCQQDEEPLGEVLSDPPYSATHVKYFHTHQRWPRSRSSRAVRTLVGLDLELRRLGVCRCFTPEILGLETRLAEISETACSI